MNKYPSLVLKATVILIMFFAHDNTAQSVILVNGVPTKVVLSGHHIKEIVDAKIPDYMSEYAHTTSDEFTKPPVTLELLKKTENSTEIKSTEAINDIRQIVAIENKIK